MRKGECRVLLFCVSVLHSFTCSAVIYKEPISRLRRLIGSLVI